MKTITVNQVNLETRKAKCNFCGEDGKTCVKGSVPFKKPKTELKWLQQGMFGERDLYRVEVERASRYPMFCADEIIGYPYICTDCILGLSKSPHVQECPK